MSQRAKNSMDVWRHPTRDTQPSVKLQEASAITRLAIFSAFMVLALPTAPSHAQSSCQLATEKVWGLGQFHRSLDYFQDPRAATVDGEGRLVIADVSRIGTYEESGHHRHEVGARGRGPGELIRNDALVSTSDGLTVVADSRLRRFTWFDGRGKAVRDAPYPPGARVISRMKAMPSDSFLASFHNGEPGGKLLHELDSDGRVKHSFVTMVELGFENDPAVANMVGLGIGLRFLILDPQTVAVAPEISNGRLLIYRRQETGWALARRHDSTEVGDSHRSHNAEDFFDSPARTLNYQPPHLSVSTSGAHGAFMTEVFRWNRGLALLENGGFAQLLLNRNDGVLSLNLEVRNENGSPTRVIILAEGPYDDPVATTQVDLSLLHQDQRGRLYFRGGVDGAPVVMRMRLTC